MPNEPDADRERRLDEVGRAAGREISAGRPFDPAAWLERHPDLRPELDARLAELQRDASTLSLGGAGGASGGGTVAFESGAGTPTEAAPDATAAYAPNPPQATEADLGQTGDFEPARGRTEPAFGATVSHGGPGPTLPFGESPADPDASTRPDPARGGGGGGVPVPGGGSGALRPGRRVKYIGDYEIVRILGQGGMGVVYEALQISLNRPVALKLIRNAEFASEEQLKRFQNEAEAVASLDDEGIVPVYEVGSFEDQRYFSMKLIEGGGLDKRLGHFSRNPKEAARVVAAVADAIHHAHQRGILHRDLKPANILLDVNDNPHVTDFGLAKRIEGDAGLTVSGAIMGTPAYMAPEQALGRTRQMTTATDVYGLGAILYAVLTEHAPFQSDSVLETLEKVRQAPPAPPTRHNAALPPDLEVICLKCLEKDPKRRYASAAALSADLNHWIKGEPIDARPVGPAARAWMWARRNPALAALNAALAAALVVGVVGIAVQWREAVYQRHLAEVSRDVALKEKAAARLAEAAAGTARDAAVASEKAAEAARAQAEQNALLAGGQANQAIQAVQDLITQVRDKMQEPRLYALKTSLIESALKRVDGVADVYDKSTSKEATTAAALMQLAKIYRELGQTEKAFKALERALKIYRERLAIKNYNDASRLNLALCLRELGSSSEELRRDMAAALGHYNESLAIWADIDANPRTPNPGDMKAPSRLVRLQLSEAYLRVGITHFALGDPAKALDYYRKALNLRQALFDEGPDDKDMNGSKFLTGALMAVGEAAFRAGDVAAADGYYKRAVDLREQALAKLGAEPEATRQLSDALYMRGWLALRTGRFGPARDDLQRARDIRAGLLKNEPENAIYQRAAGLALYYLGVLDEREGKADTAAGLFKEALAVRRKLAEISRENDRRQAELMVALARAGEPAEALKIADRIAAGPKLDNEMRVDLARTYALASRAMTAADVERVQSSQARAVALLRDAVREGYKDRVSVDTEFDLDPVRGREDFKALLADLPPPR